MDLQPILSQLEGAVTGTRKIGGAADLAAIQEGRVPAPALYVLPMEESASDMAFAGDNIQRVFAKFAVVLAVSNKADAAGAAAVNSIEALRDQVKAALHGWQAPGSTDCVRFTGGRLLSFSDGVLFWMDEFQTTFYYRT